MKAVQDTWVRRVLVVEDQSAMRTLICDTLKRHGWEVRGVGDADDALRVFPGFDPDALLTDIDLGSRPDGAELALMLHGLAPHLGIVFVSSFPRAAAGATAMGVRGAVFVGKDEINSPEDLLNALEAALTVQPAAAPSRSAGPDREGLGTLTRHQLEILALVARGASNEQIAETTDSSVRAVERSISRIFQRLNISADPAINPRVVAAARYIAAFGPGR
ncbi:response regulator [Branchiibius hedensis]|nr:response regulator transcription factor [Branchiibius hedensis]